MSRSRSDKALRLFVCSVSLGALVLGSGRALAANDLSADQAAPDAVRSRQSSELPFSDPSAADQPTRVVIAPPVGRVSFGRTADIVGQTTYSSRSQVAGIASLILFSSKPIRSDLPAAALTPSADFLPRYRITSPFGFRRDPFGGGAEFHPGIDFAAAAGSPVRATSDGLVRAAGWAGGYGEMVALELGGGVETRYGHLSKLNVTAGQHVHRGDILGFVGSTGRSTGAHLHYEVRVNGRAVNPER